jgi:hypothetical protein
LRNSILLALIGIILNKEESGGVTNRIEKSLSRPVIYFAWSGFRTYSYNEPQKSAVPTFTSHAYVKIEHIHIEITVMHQEMRLHLKYLLYLIREMQIWENLVKVDERLCKKLSTPNYLDHYYRQILRFCGQMVK